MGNLRVKDWFFRGIAYLIPKGKRFQANNLYKLATKCVTKVMKLVVEQ